MKIKKVGHCCLQIQVGEVTLLTDPGNFSTGQDSLTGIDAVLITHEHADHIHIPSVESIVVNNPQVAIYANESTAVLLKDIGVKYHVIKEGEILDIKGVSVQTWNCMHEDVYDDITPVLNTALFIEKTLLYPGDAFYVPDVEDINTLALPAEAPWMKTRDAIEYALKVKPRQAFPVHDARLNPSLGSGRWSHYDRVLTANNISWRNLGEGESFEI